VFSLPEKRVLHAAQPRLEPIVISMPVACAIVGVAAHMPRTSAKRDFRNELTCGADCRKPFVHAFTGL